jgi:hypothetical protein
MKLLLHSTLLFLCALSLLTCGCKKSEPPVADTSPALQQAFESADPALKERVAAVAADVKAKKLVDATKALDQLVSSARLTDAQAQAISNTILEMNEVAANNPEVDSKEMYDLRSKMFQSLRRRGR